jgi:hypothetical protein
LLCEYVPSLHRVVASAVALCWPALESARSHCAIPRCRAHAPRGFLAAEYEPSLHLAVAFDGARSVACARNPLAPPTSNSPADKTAGKILRYLMDVLPSFR